jgi:poly(3-hydroxybutyrate) depolymerase
MISGNTDPLMPYRGGDILVQVELDGGWPLGDPIYSGTVMSFRQTLQRFLTAHGCSTRPMIRSLPDSDGDGIFVRELTFCPQTEAVQAYVVVDGGHRWHGIGDNSEDWVRECDVIDTGSFTLNTYVFVGSTSLDGFSATRAAWRFFRGL